MSRTDKDAPYWVRAMHAAQTGQRTRTNHSRSCLDTDHPCGPRDHEIRVVSRGEAEARGYPYAEAWAFLNTRERVYARIPHGPFPCDVDTAGSRCRRHPEDRTTYRALCGDDHRHLRVNLGYKSPERAHLRDTLRAAARDYNTYGETSIEPITRQTRNSAWTGGYWD